MKYVQIAHDYCGLYGVICASLLSPLAMAEWIEIFLYHQSGKQDFPSPLAMAEWIEIPIVWINSSQELSPLAMAEWIEIKHHIWTIASSMVSASDSRVD